MIVRAPMRSHCLCNIEALGFRSSAVGNAAPNDLPDELIRCTILDRHLHITQIISVSVADLPNLVTRKPSDTPSTMRVDRHPRKDRRCLPNHTRDTPSPSVPVARRSQCGWFISAPDALNFDFAVRIEIQNRVNDAVRHTVAYNDGITVRLQGCQLACGLIRKALAPILRQLLLGQT
jgi:hypothetical protein